MHSTDADDSHGAGPPARGPGFEARFWSFCAGCLARRAERARAERASAVLRQCFGSASAVLREGFGRETEWFFFQWGTLFGEKEYSFQRYVLS